MTATIHTRKVVGGYPRRVDYFRGTSLGQYRGLRPPHSRKTGRTLRQRNSKEILGDDQ
jgi:hypothetical protein